MACSSKGERHPKARSMDELVLRCIRKAVPSSSHRFRFGRTSSHRSLRGESCAQDAHASGKRAVAPADRPGCNLLRQARPTSARQQVSNVPTQARKDRMATEDRPPPSSPDSSGPCRPLGRTTCLRPGLTLGRVVSASRLFGCSPLRHARPHLRVVRRLHLVQSSGSSPVDGGASLLHRAMDSVRRCAGYRPSTVPCWARRLFPMATSDPSSCVSATCSPYCPT